jgi:hypothetical protein
MAIAILNIGYCKFALTPKQAAEIITLLSNAAQVSEAYDHDYARRDAPKNGSSYYHYKSTDDLTTVSVTLINNEIERERRAELEKEN